MLIMLEVYIKGANARLFSSVIFPLKELGFSCENCIYNYPYYYMTVVYGYDRVALALN